MWVDLLDDFVADDADGYEDKEDDLCAYEDDRVRGSEVFDLDRQKCQRQEKSDEEKCSPTQQLRCHVILP